MLGKDDQTRQRHPPRSFDTANRDLDYDFTHHYITFCTQHQSKYCPKAFRRDSVYIQFEYVKFR